MSFYRKELDGLRALAVIAVILYHANLKIFGFQLFQGGFFGVDIFFVLSGYLITGIIRSQLEQGTFSFWNFYWRRAKRIVPALLVMLVVTTTFAYFILLPDELITYAQSLRSALYFGANYFYYGEDSYVADASIYKPLLHTWSLAVEWQFYIIYPIFVWLIQRFFQQYMFGLLLGLALLSLQFSSFTVNNYPDAAFFLLPSRAWELLLGGLITFYDRKQLTKAPKDSLENFAYKLLPMVGLFLVLHSLFFVDHHTVHPSFFTIMPVVGTCLFIMFTHKGELTNDFFSIKPIVYIGLVSYSLYLWHQPVFVFFRIIKKEAFRYEQLILLLVITSFLTFLSYKFIENVYRQKSVSKISASLLGTSIVMLVFFYYQATLHKGFPERLTGPIKEAYDMYQIAEFRRLKNEEKLGGTYQEVIRSYCNMRTVETSCIFGEGNWITIGDSYTGHYDYALKERTQNNGEGMQSLSYEQCPFVSAEIWFGTMVDCPIVNQDRLKYIATLKSPKKFIVAANYHQFSHPKKRTKNPIEDRKKGFKGGDIIKDDIAWVSYSNNIKKLLDLGHEVYVIYSIPSPGTDVKKAVFQQLRSRISRFRNDWSKDKNAYATANSLSKRLDEYLPIHPKLHKIYPKDILCKNFRCEIINQEGGVYNLGSHLSYIGANKILDEIFKRKI